MRRGRHPSLAGTVALRIDGARLPSGPSANRLDCNGTGVGCAWDLAPLRLRLVDIAWVWLCDGIGDHSPEPGGAFLRGGESDFWPVRHTCGVRLRCPRMVRLGSVAEAQTPR